MTNTESLSTVLAHHHIDVVGKSEDTLTDDARAAGLIYACLGCGTIGGIDPKDGERARQLTRDMAPEGTWECCGDTIIF